MEIYRRISSDVDFAQSSYTLSLIHAWLKQTRARFAVADAREHVRDRAGLASSRTVCACDRNRGSAHEQFRL